MRMRSSEFLAAIEIRPYIATVCLLCSDVPMPTLISEVLMLDLWTTGQGCNETESCRQSDGVAVGGRVEPREVGGEQ